MTDSLVILGAGGFARETLDVVDAINAVSPQFDCLGYIVDSQYGQPGTLINDKPILGDLSWLTRNTNIYAVCAVGAPELRLKMTLRAADLGVRFATLIHPNAIRTRWVTVGEGVVIAAGCIFTNQIQVKNHVHINLDCTIGHDVVFEDFVTLAPGVHVSGNVHLHEGCYVGTGANIVEKRQIGRWSIIGAGSTVVKDIDANVTAVGVPTQIIKTRPEGWHLQ